MNGRQKGFISPLLLVLVAILLIGGGAYVYVHNKQAISPAVVSPTASATSSAIKIGKVAINPQMVQELQSGADQGHQPWRLDPESVVSLPGGLGVLPESVQKLSLNLQTGVAEYIVTFDGRQYIVTVIQPIVGKNKVWLVSDIEYAVTSQPANWKTYTNTKYGIQIQYPNEWMLLPNGTIQNPVTKSDFVITENPNPKKLSLDGWFKEETVIGGRATVNASARATMINGVKAYRLDSELPLPSIYFEIVGIADAGNRIFSIIADSNSKNDNVILEQILSTFKFNP